MKENVKENIDSGLLLIDKPSGITSHDVVSRLRKALKTKEIGHSGTLDPLASGLMVCLLNEGTKLSQFVLEKNKEYTLTLKFGLRSDTYDSMGVVEMVNAPLPSKEDALLAAQNLQGDLLLPVPLYSATKVDGKKLYEYARSGVHVEVPQKIMKFWNLKFEDALEFPSMRFSIVCSKGSFIRAWVHRLGEILGCGAILTDLRRTKSSIYSLDKAVPLDSISSMGDFQIKEGSFIPLSQALSEIKAVYVLGRDFVFIKNGQISHELRTRLISIFNPLEDEYLRVINQKTGELLALIALDPRKGFVVRRVFH
ncbi:MAG TPA: tRNA pseudouridine(55) synthase TruB [Pseudobdellovibrionaceae bacterium]|nr:tRNA pseudouridine(55) synthase TruB [Pseudobdellovibrionaceae bacterium]